MKKPAAPRRQWRWGWWLAGGGSALVIALAFAVALSHLSAMPGVRAALSTFTSHLPDLSVLRLPEFRFGAALDRMLASGAIRDVRIAGDLGRVSEADLARAVRARLRGGFFGIDIGEIRAAALSVDWVRDVSIRKVWPDQLQLTVAEERPLARWASGGFVTERGALLPPWEGAAPPEGLPLLAGTPRALPELITGLRHFGGMLDGIGGGVAALERTPSGNWRLDFEDGVRLVFRDGQETAIRRFAELYSTTLEGRRGAIERIDLRYPNGFAVRWRADMNVQARG